MKLRERITKKGGVEQTVKMYQSPNIYNTLNQAPPQQKRPVTTPMLTADALSTMERQTSLNETDIFKMCIKTL